MKKIWNEQKQCKNILVSVDVTGATTNIFIHFQTIYLPLKLLLKRLQTFADSLSSRIDINSGWNEI